MNVDVVIIGGGILGLSVAYQLLQAHPQLNVAVLEKESTLAQHQTGHNSGVIHAGVYYKPGSLKAKFCFEGNKAIRAFCEEHKITYQLPGKLVVASDELEWQRLQELAARCTQNGLDYEVLDEVATKQAEPGIIGVGSIYVKETGIIDWKDVAKKYAELFTAAGGKIFPNETVVDMTETQHGVSIKTKSGAVYQSDYLISCAGLYADRIVKMAKLQPDFKIIPFRGEYYYLADSYARQFNHLVYPVPEPGLPFLGVHFTPQVNGPTTVGPNAVLALAREAYSWKKVNLKEATEILTFLPTWKSMWTHLGATKDEFKSSLSKSFYLKRVQKYFPDIKKEDLRHHPAGVRAQAMDKTGRFIEDFLFMQTPRMLHTCNAPSPAATSSLPIGKYIVEKFSALLNKKYEKQDSCCHQ